MNNISNYELSSIDDGIATVNDTIETNLERLVPDE